MVDAFLIIPISDDEVTIKLIELNEMSEIYTLITGKDFSEVYKENQIMNLFGGPLDEIDEIGKAITKSLTHIHCTNGENPSGFLLPYSVMWYKNYPLRKITEPVRPLATLNRVASFLMTGSMNSFSVRGNAIIVGGNRHLRKDILCEFKDISKEMYIMFFKSIQKSEKWICKINLEF